MGVLGFSFLSPFSPCDPAVESPVPIRPVFVAPPPESQSGQGQPNTSTRRRLVRPAALRGPSVRVPPSPPPSRAAVRAAGWGSGEGGARATATASPRPRREESSSPRVPSLAPRRPPHTPATPPIISGQPFSCPIELRDWLGEPLTPPLRGSDRDPAASVTPTQSRSRVHHLCQQVTRTGCIRGAQRRAATARGTALQLAARLLACYHRSLLQAKQQL